LIWFWLWIIVAIIAAIIEVIGSGLFFIGVTAAAVIAAVVAATGLAGPPVEAILFGAASILYVAGLRPRVLRLISGRGPALLHTPSGNPNLVGRRAIVTQEVTEDGGQIRVGQGEFWSARAYNSGDTMPVGARVQILLVDGLTALVAPAEASSPAEATA